MNTADHSITHAPDAPRAQAVSVPLPVLVIEDDGDDFDLIRLALASHEPAIDWSNADDEAGVEQALLRPPALILCDYNLPALAPARVLEMLAERALDIPLIVVTRAIGEDAVVDVLRRGAADYVAKDKLATLPQVIARVRAQRRVMQQQQQLHVALEVAHQRLQEMGVRAIRLHDLERARLARDLHDSLGQTLTSVHLLLEAADRAASPQESVLHRLTARERLQEAIANVKSLSFELRPAQIDVLGLPEAVRAVAARFVVPAGLKFQLSVVGDERRVLPSHAATALGVLGESLTNTVRHAQAKTVRIRLRFHDNGALTALYHDDGQGFAVGQLLASPSAHLRLGLTGIMERCELAGGRLRLKSALGHGMLLRMTL